MPASGSSISDLRATNMLQIGEKFPDFSLTATISTDKDEAKAFTTVTHNSYAGKWKLYFRSEGDKHVTNWREISRFFFDCHNFNRQGRGKSFYNRDAQLLCRQVEALFQI